MKNNIKISIISNLLIIFKSNNKIILISYKKINYNFVNYNIIFKTNKQTFIIIYIFFF